MSASVERRETLGGTAEGRAARPPERGSKWYPLLWLGTALLAVYIYQPWRDLGFDLEDFSEFQPIVENAPTLASRLGALTEYYATHGRWNVAGYAFLAAKWTLLGPEPVAWQWLRLAQMVGVAGLASEYIVRLGVNRTIAWAAGSLFLFSSAAAAAVVRMTLGEPLALVFLLGALLLATTYQATPRWKLCGIGISLCVGLLLATKEVLIVCLPFVLAFGLAWRVDAFQPVQWSRRNAFLVGLVATAAALVAIPIVRVIVGNEPGAYDSAYGAGTVEPVRYLVLAFYMLMPVQRPLPPDVLPLLYPANLLVGVLICSGLLVWFRSGGRTPQPLWSVIAALSLPLVGGAVYLPWPRFEEFYALPFLLGPLLLLALTLKAAGGQGRASYRVAVGLVVVAVLHTALVAEGATQFRFARRGATSELVETLRTLQGVDSVLVASADGGRAWYQRAATLERAVRNSAPDTAVPPMLGIRCGDARTARELPSSVVVVNYVLECGAMTRPDTSLTHHFDYRDWRTLGTRRDSFAIELRRGDR